MLDGCIQALVCRRRDKLNLYIRIEQTAIIMIIPRMQNWPSVHDIHTHPYSPQSDKEKLFRNVVYERHSNALLKHQRKLEERIHMYVNPSSCVACLLHA